MLGQFWNIPITFEPYNYTCSDQEKEVLHNPNNLYIITVNPPRGTRRRFVGELLPLPWEMNPTGCLYAGHSQGGPVQELNSPTNSVIEGNYEEYRVNGLHETTFMYTRFDEGLCH